MGVRAALVLRWTEAVTPIGMVRLCADDDGLRGLYLPDHRPAPPAEVAHAMAVAASDPGPFAAVLEQLGEYFAGQRRQFEVALSLQGTEFQRAVWQALLDVPYGHTVTYAELAEQLGRRSAVRALGAANSRNPVSIIVPCHRLVGSDGALTGYAGGVARKQFLLDLERRTAG
jgi:methylated-DNA-[protein]-cysteine S-methyltransferase